MFAREIKKINKQYSSPSVNWTNHQRLIEFFSSHSVSSRWNWDAQKCQQQKREILAKALNAKQAAEEKKRQIFESERNAMTKIVEIVTE